MAEAIERALYWAFGFNPCVALHELRLRMRAGRAFLLLLTYAVLAALAVLIPVRFVAWQRAQMYGAHGPGLSLGRVGLHALAYTVLTLIFIALPAYAAATVASEREKRTLDMLRATMLTPTDVVTGKLIVVVAFAAMLLGATVPAAAWCLMMGGVGPADVIRTLIYLFAVAVLVAGLGVVFSARFQRSLSAIVATYAVLFTLGVLSVLVMYPISVIAMIAYHASSPPALGTAAAVAFVAVPVLVTAWLLVVAARWLLGKMPFLSRLSASRTFAVIIFLVMAGLLGWRSVELIEKVSYAAPTVVALANPYASIGAMLEESWARAMIGSGTPPGVTSPAADLQGYVWSVCLWVVVAVALALWALAIRLMWGKST